MFKTIKESPIVLSLGKKNSWVNPDGAMVQFEPDVNIIRIVGIAYHSEDNFMQNKKFPYITPQKHTH